jgi:hypothetical protein
MAANWLVFFAGASCGSLAGSRRAGGLPLAGPAETTGGISNTVSSGPLAWCAFIVTIGRGRDFGGQFRTGGSVLMSTGG